jgi:hypothetical protein
MMVHERDGVVAVMALAHGSPKSVVQCHVIREIELRLIFLVAVTANTTATRVRRSGGITGLYGLGG